MLSAEYIDCSIHSQQASLFADGNAGLYCEQMFKDRLKQARLQTGLSQAQVAAAVGMKQPSYSHLEAKGEGSVLVVQLAKALGVTPDWLATGEGAMTKSAGIMENPAKYSATNTEPAPWPAGLVPLVSSVQAGTWCEAVDNFQPGEAEEWVPAPAKHSPHAYALRVTGTSMEPRFREGEIIVVDPEISADSGKFVVAKKTGSHEVTLKQLIREGGESYLKAMNPHWPEPIIRMTEDWNVCGVVICKLEMF